MTYSARYDAALALAAQLHQRQMRKGTEVPYITHVVYVSVLLIEHGYGEDVAIAGLLHDVVEDQRYPIERVAEQFGPHVARLVAAMSEHRYDGDVERPWETRKQEKIAMLRESDREVLALKAADLLHNVHSTLNDLRAHGPAVWSRFTRGRDGLLWYYREVLGVLSERMQDHVLVEEVAQAVAELEALASRAP